MGNDLLLNTVWIDKDAKIDWDALKTHIASLTENDCKNHPEYEYEISHQEFIENALRMYDYIKEALSNDYTDRHTYCMSIGKYNVLISGGDSWGDTPSEYFDYIQFFAELPGIEKFGLYPKD